MGYHLFTRVGGGGGGVAGHAQCTVCHGNRDAAFVCLPTINAAFCWHHSPGGSVRPAHVQAT